MILFEKIVKPQVLNQPMDKEVFNMGVTEKLPPLLNYLESEIQGKKWFAGNMFSVADIAIAAHFVSLKLCEVPVDKNKYPNLVKHINKVLNRESFKKAN